MDLRFWLFLAGFSFALGLLTRIITHLFKTNDDNLSSAGVGLLVGAFMAFSGELPDVMNFAAMLGLGAASAFIGSFLVSIFLPVPKGNDATDPHKEKTKPGKTTK